MWGCNITVSWGGHWGGGPASSETCIPMSGPLGELGGDESQDDEDGWCTRFTDGLLWMHWWLVSPAQLVNWWPHVAQGILCSLNVWGMVSWEKFAENWWIRRPVALLMEVNELAGKHVQSKICWKTNKHPPSSITPSCPPNPHSPLSRLKPRTRMSIWVKSCTRWEDWCTWKGGKHVTRELNRCMNHT